VQTVRDAYVVTSRFAEGKRDVGNYVKAAFTVVGLAALAVPGARAAKGIFEKARVAVTGAQAEARIAREALKKVGRIVGEGVSETESVAVRVLANDGDQEAKKAMTLLLGVCDVRLAAMAIMALPSCAGLSDEALEALNRVAPRFGEAPFVKVLGRLRSKGFGEDIIERLVRALDDEALRTLRLSDDALEGLAVFLTHTKSARRLPNVWRELTQFVLPAPLPPQQAEQVVERLCLMLKSGNDRIAAALAVLPADKAAALARDWHNFIARGAGTSARRNSTVGFFHHLENLLKEAPEKIELLDGVGEQLGYFGRPDLIIKKLFESIEKLVHKEFKNKAAGQLLSDKEVGQLWNIIDAAKTRASQTAGDFATNLRDQLGRTIYVFRGPPRQDLRQQIFEEAEKALGQGFKDLAATLRDAIEFTGTLPF
jgi:hypothetical protein